MRRVLPIRNTSLSVLLNQKSALTGTCADFGSPVKRINSPGCMATNTFGTCEAAPALPGRLALTSFQFSSSGSLLNLAGSLPAGDHGPFTSLAFNHESSLR